MFVQLVRLTFFTRHSQEERIDIWAEDDVTERKTKETYDNPAYSGSRHDLDNGSNLELGQLSLILKFVSILTRLHL